MAFSLTIGIIIEDKEQLILHRRQFALTFATWLSLALTRLHRLLLVGLSFCLIDLTKGGQQLCKFGLRQSC